MGNARHNSTETVTYKIDDGSGYSSGKRTLKSDGNISLSRQGNGFISTEDLTYQVSEEGNGQAKIFVLRGSHNRPWNWKRLPPGWFTW